MTQGFVNPFTYATSAPTITSFTSGSGTYTVPAGVKFLIVQMLGGGGGGAGSGTSGGTGGAGGNTTFGTATAAGGSGGVNNNTVGGAGGAPTTGTIVGTAITGATGDGPFTADVNSVYPKGGMGGVTPLGGAGAGSGGSAAGAGGNAIANTGSGGGGAGGARAAIFGGAGGGAGAYICGTIASPAASYSYAIGAAGTAGTAGTSCQAGGAGGSGVIYVYEYYEVLGIPTSLTLPLPVSNGGTGISVAPFANMGGTCTGTLNTSWNNVIYPNVVFDTTGSYNASTGIYTCPVKGRYQIYASFSVTGASITAGNYVGIAISTNSSHKVVNIGRAAVSTGNGTFTSQATSFYECNAGDTINIQSTTNYGTPSYGVLLDTTEFTFCVNCVGSY